MGMKFKGEIKHPKDLVTKEFVENFVENKFRESSDKEIKPRDEVIGENLYLGGQQDG